MTSLNLNCPTCNSNLAPALTISGQPSEFWLECTKCNTLINTYKPQPHQLQVHLDSHLYVMNAGGYGTGKTLTTRQEVYKHAFITPNANILIGANITAQYEQTIKRDIEADLPKILVSKVNAQKSYIDLVNGARIMFRPFDDPDKLRSLNLSMFVIIEASETDGDTFHQLKTRLRSHAAFTNPSDPNLSIDWRKGIIETNPGVGWIRSDVLLNASTINTYGSTVEQNPVSLTPDPNISVHIASTDSNAYLPPNFIQELTTNKPSWWVQKFVYGSFMYAEGLVYPSGMKSVVPAFKIPLHWKRLIACDYGLANKFAFLAGAIDPLGVVYIYKNETTTNKNVEALAKQYFEFTDDIPQGALYTAPMLDPKSGAKRDYNKKTLYDHFLDFNIAFQPGHISVDARIFRGNTYFESGKLKIMDSCPELIEELENYKFPERSLSSKSHSNKPVDKDNHSINAMEWICMALPANPGKLQYGSYAGNYFDDNSKKDLPWQLSDPNQSPHDNAPLYFDIYS